MKQRNFVKNKKTKEKMILIIILKIKDKINKFKK